MTCPACGIEHESAARLCRRRGRVDAPQALGRLTPDRPHRFGAIVAACLAALVLAGCGSHGRARVVATTPSARDASGTVWLCRPGEADNPCLADLTATVVERNGTSHVEHTSQAKSPPVDCFYVYPTISGQQTINANRDIDLRLQEVAIAQASRFSQVCRVYAPVYRQITLSALDHPKRITLADALLAYADVRAAFDDYLKNYNHGRGIVFIGHSQGAVILTRLLQREVDGDPAVRRRLVSALLLGGNVTVRTGQAAGGDFAHIPACASTRQTGCVVAYSSFASKPLPNSQFGRTSSDAGVGILAPRDRSPNLRILCVNPAAPAGGSAPLTPYLPSLVLTVIQAPGASLKTPWMAFPGEYTARCETSGDATWLQVTRAGGAADHRPVLTRLQDPVIGLHVLDVNLALANLVQLAGAEAAAYRR